MDYGYDVFVKVDSSGRITSINSSAFISDMVDWVLVEANVQGDKGHHAQGHYLPKPIRTMQGIYQYKLVDGIIVERTAEEITADAAKIPPPLPIAEDRIKALEGELAALKPKVATLEAAARKTP